MPALVYKIQEQEHRFPLKERTAIGRDPRNDLCVPSDSISSQHAVITRSGNDGYQLEDAGSSNGIVVGGKRVLSCALEGGSVFSLGDIEFAFALDEPEPGAAESRAQSEEAIARFKEAHERVLGEIGKVVVGQREVLDQMLVALFARGHCLLIGVPGLAKTLMVRTLGGAIDLDTCRIQFTPDLMPSDITGTDILEEDSVTG